MLSAKGWPARCLSRLTAIQIALEPIATASHDDEGDAMSSLYKYCNQCAKLLAFIIVNVDFQKQRETARAESGPLVMDLRDCIEKRNLLMQAMAEPDASGDLGVDIDAFTVSLVAFKKCRFYSSCDGLLASIGACFQAHGRTNLEPFRVFMTAFFPDLHLTSMEGVFTNGLFLKKMQEQVLPEDLFIAKMQYACSVGDVRLQDQVSFCHRICKLTASIAKLIGTSKNYTNA